VIRSILLFLFLSSVCYAGPKTLDAGNIVAEISEFGDTYEMLWPKGPEQKDRVWSIQKGIAYEHESTTTDTYWNYGDTANTYEGFFEQTERAAQEVRTLTTMTVANKLLRVRTSYRAYNEGTNRANEIEMVYEYRNQTVTTMNDFYYGIVLDIWVPYTSWSYGFDAGGNLTIIQPENEGASYVKSKNMFWFGNAEQEFYVAVLVVKDSTDPVHTAKLYDYYSGATSPNYSMYAEGTIPDPEIDMTDISDPVIMFSQKHHSLEPNEKVYMKVVISFAKTAEELVGNVNRILSSSKVPVEPLFTSAPKEGTFEPPKSSSGGGCFIKNNLKKNHSQINSLIKKPSIFDFELVPMATTR